MRLKTQFALRVLLTAAPLFATPLAAQKGKKTALDRTLVPAAGKPTVLRVPTWSKTKLANGADLIISQKRDLPLVSVSINFIGGGAQFEDAQKLGVASLTTQMLNEGTSTRSGDQLADAQQMLGTQIGTFIGPENGSMQFTSLSDKLEPALDLMADMLLNPAFPDDALKRRRSQMIVQLTTAKDQPNSVANNVFSKVVYGDAHPYGRVVSEATVNNITRDDIVAFHRAYFRPGRAIITVVGDVDPARVKAAMEKSLANWQAGGDRPSFSYPPPPPPRNTTIYLVDKPKAAQSVFAMGEPGPARDTPDYYAISVMNTVLGGLFQSRLNHLIREVKGYSYGVNSGFAFGKGPGAFRAGGGIITAKTDSALIDFVNELKGVQGSKPFTDDEMQQGKASLIQRLPQRFASVDATASAISSIYTQGLPENYFQDFASNVNKVTADDLMRVARQYIDMGHMNIIIVGDRATIDEPLRRTGIAPIVYLDIEGKPIAAAVP